MNPKKLKLLSVPLSLSIGFIGTLLTLTAFASGSTMLLSPASQTVNNGSTFTVQVRANVSNNDSGDDDGITTRLSFPANRLQVTGISSSGASFRQAAQQSYNNSTGRINIFQSWGNAEPTGNLLIATITFRAITPGNASVAYTYAEVGNDDAATLNGTYTVVTPPPPPPAPAPPATPPNAPSAPAPSTPQPSATPPSPSSATSSVSPATAPVLAPSNQATSTAPTQPETNEQPATKSFPVTLRVTDNNKTPIQNAKLVLNGKTHYTDKKGSVHTTLATGNHAATISAGGTTKKVGFTVKQQSATQQYSFVVVPANSFGGILFFGGIAAGAVLLLAAVAFVITRRRRQTEPGVFASEPFASPQVADDPALAPTLSQEPEQPGLVVPYSESIAPTPAAALYDAPTDPSQTGGRDVFPSYGEEVTPVISEPIANVQPDQTYAPEASPSPQTELTYSSSQGAGSLQPEPVPESVPEPQPEVIVPAYEQPVEVDSPTEPTPSEPDHPHRHDNSVYLNEEEPKDMYEVANEQFHYRDRPAQQ